MIIGLIGQIETGTNDTQPAKNNIYRKLKIEQNNLTKSEGEF